MSEGMDCAWRQTVFRYRHVYVQRHRPLPRHRWHDLNIISAMRITHAPGQEAATAPVDAKLNRCRRLAVQAAKAVQAAWLWQAAKAVQVRRCRRRWALGVAGGAGAEGGRRRGCEEGGAGGAGAEGGAGGAGAEGGACGAGAKAVLVARVPKAAPVARVPKVALVAWCRRWRRWRGAGGGAGGAGAEGGAGGADAEGGAGGAGGAG